MSSPVVSHGRACNRVDAEALEELVVRVRGPVHPRLDPGAFGGPLAELPAALGREPSAAAGRAGPATTKPIGHACPSSPKRRSCAATTPVRLDDLAADRLRGGLRRVACAQAADRLRDERALPGELDRALLERPLVRHVALDGHVARDRARGVADRRDDGLLGEERAVLAPVDEVGHPGHAVRERGPHGLVERGRLEAALEEAWVTWTGQAVRRALPLQVQHAPCLHQGRTERLPGNLPPQGGNRVGNRLHRRH